MYLKKSALLPLSALTLLLGGRIALAQETSSTFSLDDPKSKRAVVATVGPTKITAEEFRLSFEFGPAFAKRTNDAKQRYLNYMINEKLLALDALSRKDIIGPMITPALNEFEGDLATEELYKDDVLSKVKVSGSEIARGMEQSKRHLKLQWIFAPTKGEITQVAARLRSGSSFDSLYRLQGPDSMLASGRSLDGTVFQIRMDNAEIGAVADTLKYGHPSAPLQGADGWYILLVADASRDLLETQSDDMKLQEDVSRALLQQKSDSVSKLYINSLMATHSPVLDSATVDLVASYLALKRVAPADARQWGMITGPAGGKDSASLSSIDKRGELTLVRMAHGAKIALSEFLNWYRNRETLIKLNKSSKQAYLYSLVQVLWQMVRDHILVERAFKRHLQERETVRTQKQWWKDKLLFEAERRFIQDSIPFKDNMLLAYYKDNQRHYRNSQGAPLTFADARDDVLRDYYEDEMTKRIFHRVLALKKKYAVSVDDSVLGRIPVGMDPKAIDVYAVKKGGTFPRPAFPVIDMMWQTWR